MSSRNPMAERELVHLPAGTERVRVRVDESYSGSSGETLSLDVYAPPSPATPPFPVVVIAAGYPDAGFRRVVGCRFKEMAANVSWAKAMAASGLAAVTYSGVAPLADLGRVVEHVRTQADRYELDPARVGLFAASGNAPVALAFGAEGERPWLRCISISYGYVLDPPGSAATAEIGRTFGFAVPPARDAKAFPADLPLLIVRAGRDEMPKVNASTDAFVADALAANLPITVSNVPAARHAFDILDDAPATRIAIETILTFLRLHLQTPP